MLSKKNKDLRSYADGVVGKYVKKDTPAVVPSELMKFIHVSFKSYYLNILLFINYGCVFFTVINVWTADKVNTKKAAKEQAKEKNKQQNLNKVGSKSYSEILLAQAGLSLHFD